MSGAELSTQARRGLAAVGMSRVLIAMDIGIMAVALPRIQADLHVSIGSLFWAAAVYAIVYAALTLPCGTLADLLGRRRIFILGLVVFIIGALGSGLANSAEWLVWSRALQGVGAALISPASWALLAATVSGDALKRAVAVRSATTAAGAAAGPLLGGVLVATLGWRWVFFALIPVALISIVLTMLFVGESRGEERRRIDWAGAVLVIVCVGALCKGLIDLGHQAGPLAYGQLAVAIVTGVLLYLRLRTAADPLIRLSSLSLSPIPTALVVALGVNFAMTGSSFVEQVVAQSVLGISPLVAGLMVLPAVVLFVALAGVSTKLTDRFGIFQIVSAGLVVAALGLVILATTGPGSSWVVFPLGFTFIGIGMGVVTPPTWAAALSVSPKSETAAVSGALGLTRHLGDAIGLAIFGAVVAGWITLRWPHGGMEGAQLASVQSGHIAAVTAEAGAEIGARAASAYAEGAAIACLVGAAALVIAAVAVFAARRGSDASVAEHAGQHAHDAGSA